MSKRSPKPNRAEQRAVSHIDDVLEFEKFRAEILPQLRKAIHEGKSAEEIYKMGQSLAAARTVTIAATEEDSAKALAAVKEILDRSGGKATEKRVVEHKYGKLKDEALDSLLLTELDGVDISDRETH